MELNRNQQVPPSNMGAPMSPPPQGAGSNKTVFAILAYLNILVVVPLAANKENDPFVKFHAKQGLVLLIGWVIGWAVYALPAMGGLLGSLITLGCVALSIVGIMNVVNGQTKELPVIGSLASMFNF